MRDTEVEIYGTSYVIKGDADPEYVRQLARYVDEKMRSVARKGPANVGGHKVAVLAALNIADELYRLRRRQHDVERMVHEKTGDLFDLLQDGPEGD